MLKYSINHFNPYRYNCINDVEFNNVKKYITELKSYTHKNINNIVDAIADDAAENSIVIPSTNSSSNSNELFNDDINEENQSENSEDIYISNDSDNSDEENDSENSDNYEDDYITTIIKYNDHSYSFDVLRSESDWLIKNKDNIIHLYDYLINYGEENQMFNDEECGYISRTKEFNSFALLFYDLYNN